jgi:HAD superfamily hydrolase (TIGR01509 family)
MFRYSPAGHHPSSHEDPRGDIETRVESTMPAILFGSISTVADTSELQRQAFNQAFDAHDLGWQWDQDTYRSMLASSGGRARIAEYAESQDQSVDAAAVHETKSALFQQNVAEARLAPRSGVVDTIRGAKDQGWKVGLVTTTSRENISALLAALTPDVRSDDFDVIVDATTVEQPKPDKAAYTFAMQTLGETPAGCVAIEDNVEGVQAAAAAGLPCVAFPNENTAQHDFAAAERSVDHLDVDGLQKLTHNR